jgi:flagellar assembly factor FliW
MQHRGSFAQKSGRSFFYFVYVSPASLSSRYLFNIENEDLSLIGMNEMQKFAMSKQTTNKWRAYW